MASKADFTEAEWQTMEKSVTGAGMLVALADANFFDSFKEAGTLAGFLNEARQKSQSLLVRDLAATRQTGFGMGTKPDDLESGTVEALQSSLATLAAKAPDEVAAYRSFVLDLGTAVAQAAGGVAPAENAALDKLKAALEPTAS
jgi:hypothetical protein